MSLKVSNIIRKLIFTGSLFWAVLRTGTAGLFILVGRTTVRIGHQKQPAIAE